MPLYCTMVNACERVGSCPIRWYKPQPWGRNPIVAGPLSFLVAKLFRGLPTFHDCQTAPTGPVFLSLPMDVMEEMTTIDIGEVSTIDRAAVAGSLDRLTEYLAAIPPGKLAIIAGDEISTSNAAAETVLLADGLGAPVHGSSWPAHIPFPTAHPLWIGQSSHKGDRDCSKVALL
jgi:thiamine pyrophosphate-dependent acetolactate synthase large subunit-like protein